MSGEDAIHAGCADHFVPSDQLDALVEAVALDGIEAIARFTQDPPSSALAGSASWIDRDYAHDTAEQIVAALQAAPEPAAQKAALAILAASPTAVTGTLRAVRQVVDRALTLEQAINVEYALACQALRHPDLAEGIRAQVIDKDRNPTWQPGTLAQVPDLDDWFVLPAALPFPAADDPANRS
jgi:enoyl-CoA hydratase